MRSRKKTTKWNIFFHYYSIGFSIVWGVLLVPLYLKYIPLHIYGAWLATGNVVAWLTVVDPGISDVLRQKVGKAYGERALDELNDLLCSGTLLSLFISLVILITAFIMSNYILGFIKIQDINNVAIIKNAFLLAAIGSSLMIFSYGFTSFNIGLLSSVGIGVVFVVATISSLIINFALLLKGYGLYSIPISLIFRAVILIIGNLLYIIWRYAKESLQYRFSLNGMFELAKLSSYNFLGRIGSVMVSNVDALLVARYIGAEAAPVLVLTKKGPELSRMFVERPPIAMLPAITHAWGSNEFDKVRENTLRLFKFLLWMMGLIFSGFMVLNASFVSLWVGEKLYAGDTINTIICISLPLLIVVSVFSNILFSLGYIKETSKTNFIQSIITIVALFIGVKFFGLLGLVLAQMISFLFYSVWYFPMKTIQVIKYDSILLKQLFQEIIKVLGVSCLVIISMNQVIQITNWYLFFTYGAILFSSYVGLLFILSKPFQHELMNLLLLIKRRM
jgi:O-antigen/teichoic acid export membrane protein